MAEERISAEELYEQFYQAFGMEGARKLINEAITEAGLLPKKDYAKEEALKICEVLKKKSGFVKTIANLYSVRLRLRHSK